MNRRPELSLLTLTGLCLSTLSGCIFSNNFGEGNMETSPDMPASMADMTTPVDQSNTPDQEMTPDQGEPTLSDMMSMDASPPPDMDVECQDNSDCDRTFECSGNVCVSCENEAEQEEFCGRGMFCGKVPTRSEEQCDPEFVECGCSDPSEEQCFIAEGKQAGTCVLDSLRCEPPVAYCTSVSFECMAVQQMCLGQGFDTDRCMLSGAAKQLCSLARRSVGDFSARSDVALGQNMALVISRTDEFPSVYEQSVRGLWSFVDLAFDISNWSDRLLAQDESFERAVHRGLAVAISPDDKYLAMTIQYDVSTSDDNGKPRRAVVVLTKAGPTDPYVIHDAVVDDGETLGDWLDLEGSTLAIGSPRSQGGIGEVLLRDLSSSPPKTLQKCRGSVSEGIGRQVTLTSTSPPIAFSLNSDDERDYSVVSCSEEGNGDSRSHPSAGLDVSAISASGSQLLVRRNLPNSMHDARLFNVNTSDSMPTLNGSDSSGYPVGVGTDVNQIAELQQGMTGAVSPLVVMSNADEQLVFAPFGHTADMPENSLQPIRLLVSDKEIQKNIHAVSANSDGIVAIIVNDDGEALLYFIKTPKP